MKKFVYSFLAMAGILALASCSSGEDITSSDKDNSTSGKLVPMTFIATHESSTTRTAIGDTKTENDITTSTIVWKAGDKISIFDGINNNEFTLVGEGGSSTGTFTGVADPNALEYVAVYPYSNIMVYEIENGGVGGVIVPEGQNPCPNSFDPKAAIMMAKNDNGILNFKNAVGYVKVTPKFDCKGICFFCEDENINLSGAGLLKYNEGAPCVYMGVHDGNKIAWLEPYDYHNDVIMANTPYYIAVNQCELRDGWGISFTTNSKTYTRMCNYPIVINRSQVVDLGTFDIEADYWCDEHRGIVKASQEVDLGLTITKDNKTYKVIFAKSNLTATGLAENESDFGDYFAWGATEPWYSSYSLSSSGVPTVASDDWKDGKSDGYSNTNCPSMGDDVTYVENSMLKIRYDAARKILKGDWQIPSKEIWTALVNDCTWQKVTEGTAGFKVTNPVKSMESLFIPANGIFGPGGCNFTSSKGFYWSSSVPNNNSAYDLEFELSNDDKGKAQNASYRYYGFSIRPIRLELVQN